MKKSLITTLFLIILCFPSYSQEMKFTLKENLELNLDFNKMEFIIQKVFIDGGGEGSDIFSTYYRIEYSGYIIINESLIKCVDEVRKEIFLLKKLNNYVYITVNNTKYLQKSKIIYASSYLSKDKNLIINMKWKNGKKEGDWLYIDVKNNTTYVITYDQDVRVNRRILKPAPQQWQLIR